ncbi:MAG: C_GCAxxG_C_C family protein [Magnetococcales bacterium]|nr:C_GCAxxG_C_C family protein [Magnetococcales bacterium]MBF0322086.1 C_GCAxxG_C_C family protein [Magnetococcales bacterium]
MAVVNQQEQELLVMAIRQRADALYEGGLCCSEAVFLAVVESLGEEPDRARNLVPLASGFCGGMGNRNATCGVYTGGAMAAGLLVGKTTPQDKEKSTRNLTARFQERLLAEAGALRCQDLLDKFGPIRNIGKRMCRRLTAQGAEILARTILESKA